MHHMYTVGLDVDTRAYFTAATCAISFNKTSGVNTPLLFFHGNLYKKYSTNVVKKGNLMDPCKNTETTALTLWNKPLGLSSLNLKKKITNIERNTIQLTSRARSIIVGMLLSDAWIQQYGHWNPRVGMKQSDRNFPYLWLVYNELAYLCSGPLYESKQILRGKTFYSWSFQTRQLPCMMEIYNLLYIKNKLNIKTIKSDLFFYLDYIALAHWIQGDGASRNKGICLCTHDFTLKEVVLLLNILIIKFDIQPTIYSVVSRMDPEIYKAPISEQANVSYQIQINSKDLKKLKPMLLPHFSSHFLYKINHASVKH